LCGRFVWTENGDASRSKCIGDTGDEGRLWADDDEFDTLFRRIVRDEWAVGRVERHRLDHISNSGIPGGDHNLVSGRVTQQCVDDGVLSGTRPNHEYLHEPKTTD